MGVIGDEIVDSTVALQRGFDWICTDRQVVGVDTIVEFLLRRGRANPNCKSLNDVYAVVEGDTILHMAAKRNRPNVLRVLLKYGADVETQNSVGETVLCVEPDNASCFSLETLRVVLEYAGGTSIINTADKDGITPLHLATTQRNHVIVDLLLENGANPIARDKEGRSPVVNSLEDGFHCVSFILLRAGAWMSLPGIGDPIGFEANACDEEDSL